MIQISAFADEISPDLDQQIAVLAGEGIRHIELRGAWNTNVLDLSDEQIDTIRRRLLEEGMAVSAIGSPLGKVSVDVPEDQELKRLDRAISLARTFQTPLIRIFSFYPPKGDAGDGAESYRGDVMARLRVMAVRASDAGVALVHENDTDLYGDTIERCLDVLQSVDSVNLVQAFDPANFVVSGVQPYPDAYDALQPWIRHVHVKDAREDRTVVPAGDGIARWPELLARLRSDGYDGFFSLEPHLAAAGRYAGFSGPDLFRQAARAFKGLLDAMGWEYA
jgi:sugar phosphate isomerase/epimerase